MNEAVLSAPLRHASTGLPALPRPQQCLQALRPCCPSWHPWHGRVNPAATAAMAFGLFSLTTGTWIPRITGAA